MIRIAGPTAPKTCSYFARCLAWRGESSRRTDGSPPSQRWHWSLPSPGGAANRLRPGAPCTAALRGAGGSAGGCRYRTRGGAARVPPRGSLRARLSASSSLNAPQSCFSPQHWFGPRSACDCSAVLSPRSRRTWARRRRRDLCSPHSLKRSMIPNSGSPTGYRIPSATSMLKVDRSPSPPSQPGEQSHRSRTRGPQDCGRFPYRGRARPGAGDRRRCPAGSGE